MAETNKWIFYSFRYIEHWINEWIFKYTLVLQLYVSSRGETFLNFNRFKFLIVFCYTSIFVYIIFNTTLYVHAIIINVQSTYGSMKMEDERFNNKVFFFGDSKIMFSSIILSNWLKWSFEDIHASVWEVYLANVQKLLWIFEWK